MREIVVDCFAGGGGASTGIEMAGLPVDEACNHNPIALAMHRANHPNTRHHCQHINSVDPRDVAQGRQIGFVWFSPDCTQHSKAKGGKPIRRHLRDLAHVVPHWAQKVGPRVMAIENVEEFQDWAPVLDDGRPCPLSRGMEFKRWVASIERCGYKVEWREMRAHHYGTPTIRKRLFVLARRDGLPIVWPDATHGPGLLPYRQAAECIDWSIPVRSIFGREKDLAEATCRRIARGVYRYVLDCPDPFVVSLSESLIAAPYFVPRYGERPGQDPRCQSVQEPLSTIVPTQNGASLCAAFLAQHNTGATGHDMRGPVSTICGSGSRQQLVTSHLMITRNNTVGQAQTEPFNTITGSHHFAEVRAFLIAYYGTDQDTNLQNPLPTITTHDRFGVVTIRGIDWTLVDIGMRMLSPRELFLAQGFPREYKIDPIYNGKPLTKTAQVRCCGNSVCPPLAAAIVRANVTLRDVESAPPTFDDLALFQEVA